MMTTSTPISKTYLSSLIPKGAMILDVGAYNGQDALQLSEACNTVVHAFEPYPASYEQIKLLRDDRVIAWPYALGGFKGTATLNIAKGHVQSNSIREPKKHKKIWPNIKFRGTTTINVRTLDDWFAMWQTQDAGCGHIDLAWVDVNGSELDFIVGGARTLQLVHYLYIEYCAIELYKDAMNREATIKALPGFEVVGDFGVGPSYGNLLLRNKKMNV